MVLGEGNLPGTLLHVYAFVLESFTATRYVQQLSSGWDCQIHG